MTSQYHLDAIVKGLFPAINSNILTVAACENSVSKLGTIRNTAPWILTVGAFDLRKKKL